jgi:hypothetical protein
MAAHRALDGMEQHQHRQGHRGAPAMAAHRALDGMGLASCAAPGRRGGGSSERFVQPGSSMTMHRLRLAALAMSVFAGGQPSARAQASPGPPARPPARPADHEPPPPQRFERDMMMRFHMHASFDAVRGIERLLIRGKLEDARYFARALAAEPDPPGLAAWARQIAAVRERAAAVAAAPGIEEACRREARLAEACASCHADAGAQPEFQPPALPPDQQTVAARMARHQWAADRIWEGMVGDADDAWNAGLDVLAAAPLSWPGADRAALAHRLQQLAGRARHPAKTERADRAGRYGEILVTCAACHGPAAT